LPLLITRTYELPVMALVGTTSTLLRLAIVTVSVPVMPGLIDAGTLVTWKVTV
jgi:hypothetical protein